MSTPAPTFVETTRIAIATEDTWGDAGANAAYRLLPLLAESLRPEMQHLSRQSLSGLADTPPLLGTSLAGGEIEAIADTATIKTLLPHVLMADAVRDVHNTGFTFPTDANGRHELTSPPASLAAGDFIWHDAGRQNSPVATGFYPVEQEGNTLYATGFPADIRIARLGLQSRQGMLAGKGLRSFSLMRNYGEAATWMRFSGMCIERLVLDADEGRFITMAASLVGKGMEDNLAAPTDYTEAPVAAPLGIASGFKSFHIGTAARRFSHDEIILTGFRLVLERSGMAPRHVLGSHAPVLVNPGRLSVYGHLDMLVSRHELFSWLLAEEALAISLVLHDSASSPRGGVALAMQRVKLTGVESLPRGGDDLLAARFAFNAESDDAAGGHVIRFSIHG